MECSVEVPGNHDIRLASVLLFELFLAVELQVLKNCNASFELQPAQQCMRDALTLEL